jgi:hypothetical protein
MFHYKHVVVRNTYLLGKTNKHVVNADSTKYQHPHVSPTLVLFIGLYEKENKIQKDDITWGRIRNFTITSHTKYKKCVTSNKMHVIYIPKSYTHSGSCVLYGGVQKGTELFK